MGTGTISKAFGLQRWAGVGLVTGMRKHSGREDRKFHRELVYAEGYFKSSVYLTAEWGEDVSLPRPNNSQRSGSEHCALWAHYTIALENRMLIHTPEGLFSQALGLDLHVNHMAAAIWHTAMPDDENLWTMEVVQLVKCFPWEHGDLRSALQHPWKRLIPALGR